MIIFMSQRTTFEAAGVEADNFASKNKSPIQSLTK
jgi:hypothetical protein